MNTSNALSEATLNIEYTVCSWDVGIKNLAFCILSKKGDIFTIKKWDIINLVEDQYHICKELKRDKNECGNKASFYGKLLNTKKYYCGSHKKNHIIIPEMEQNNDVTEYLDVAKCQYIYPKKGTTCVKYAKYKYKDNVYCKSHCKIIIDKIRKNCAVQKIKIKKCTLAGTLELSLRMYIKLDKIKELLQVDEVLIENQPTFKNPTMKTISALLFGYFVNRGIIDRTENKIKNIRFISPSNKLKINEDRTLQVLSRAQKAEEKYKLTKALAVKYTKILLKDSKEWLVHLEKYRKKDDLCDAYLQGYHYLYKMK